MHDKYVIAYLYHSSQKLHEYVVQKLIREGIDQCNKAMEFLCRIKATSQRSRALREQCDIRVSDLNERITEIDRKVTAVGKEVDVLLSQDSTYDAFDGDSESDSSFSHQSRRATKRNSSDAQYDRHQHASKRRKTSSKKRQLVSKYHGERRENATQRKKSNSSAIPSRRNAGIQNRDREETGTRDSSVHMDLMQVNFAGGTDEANDHQPAPSRMHASRKERQGQLSKSTFRQAQSATARANANTKDYAQRMGRVTTKRNRLSQSRLDSSMRHSWTNANATVSTDARSNTSKSSEPHAYSDRVRLTEPPLPPRLRPRHLFESLLTTTKVSKDHFYDNDIPPSPIAQSVYEICQSITRHYPSNLNACTDCLSDLNVLVHKELPENDVAIIFNTILAVFRKRCSSFLDLICSNPKDACFQIRCWNLIFKMLHHKLQSKLKGTDEDGAVFRIFQSDCSPLAKHIILQMIDCLYSQLLWREWGATPRFNDYVLDCMAQLRNQIGLSFDILKLTGELLRSNFVAQSWHRSKLTDEKENDRLYFVSSISPDDHVQFMSTGQRHNLNEGRPSVRNCSLS